MPRSFAPPRPSMVTWATMLGALFAVAPSPPGVDLGGAAYAAEATASAETNIDGLVAEIVQCRRSEGVLTIQMRLHNTTGNDITVPMGDYDGFYVTAKNKKYLLIRDKDGNTLSTYWPRFSNITIRKNANWAWWGRYTAPPSDVNHVSFYTPFTIPFDGLSITEE